MTSTNPREVWLRGPLPNVPPLLQPVAHALLQAREELDAALLDFPEDQLWARPAGVASVGFHLQHLTGVLDRLGTYAQGHALSDNQLQALSGEGQCPEPPCHVFDLIQAFDEQVERMLAQLRKTDPDTLLEARGVGRAQLPSTVLGLLVHAAEHTTRHLGQLLVTSRILREKKIN
ncbi:DinB family protein [Hymenobacter sp. BT491]|uniref:DinB family protein n=1 Tax=Hymenobacter sp. BT491 TaxID=2766779 RepID=UPI001653589F|nr:DinB family protein [Hymenobacter sp. BT491]MBC6988115.1 DinB family protein [Hymenobacter sp. BT491]